MRGQAYPFGDSELPVFAGLCAHGQVGFGSETAPAFDGQGQPLCRRGPPCRPAPKGPRGRRNPLRRHGLRLLRRAGEKRDERHRLRRAAAGAVAEKEHGDRLDRRGGHALVAGIRPRAARHGKLEPAERLALDVPLPACRRRRKGDAGVSRTGACARALRCGRDAGL